MTGIIVSAHGGRYSNQKPNLVVPRGSRVVFYVADGGLLPNREGYEILAALSAGKTPKTPVVQAVNAGQPTYDYACWCAADFGPHCGIFEVGTGRLLKSLENYDGHHPYLLSSIFHDFPNQDVYWDCCREVSPADGELINSPDAYLNTAVEPSLTLTR